MQKSLISLVIPVGMVTETDVSLFFQKRRETGHLDGFWEFPGGKIEANETPLEAAKREYQEECGLKADKLVHFKTFAFEYDDRSLCFYCYLAKCDDSAEMLKEFKFNLDTKSNKYENTFPAANDELIDHAVEYLTDQIKCGEFERIWM